MRSESCSPLDYVLPTQITFGLGRVRELAEIAPRFGRRALLVTTPGVPHADAARAVLARAGVEAVVFDRAEPNPGARSVDLAAEVAREAGCEMTIGLGGGSSIDTAKGAAAMAVNEGGAWEYTIEYRGERREMERRPLPIIAVPTTAGTGSEVNHIAVLSNRETGQKGPMRSDLIRPTHALIDPELTVTMPPPVTASTGFDALTHAFERYFAGRWHPFVDAMATSAISAVIEQLPRALESPRDLEARSRMAWAATQAAMCVLAPLGESGLHIFALAVSAVLDAVHGRALAAMMPHVLADLTGAYPDRAARLAEMLGDEPRAARAVPAMTRWLDRIGMTVSLKELGAAETDLDALVAATSVERIERGYHRPMDVEDLRTMYRLAMG